MMKFAHRMPHAVERCRGFILLVVLVTIVVLTLSAFTFSLLMITEDKATRLMGRQIQSRYLVESGVEYSRIFLSNDGPTIREMGGLWDNANQFQGKLVSINPQQPEQIGRFTIIASNMDLDGNPEGFRYGLTDESTRLNLNVLTHADNWLPGGGRQLLMALPQMTEEIADAILDWIDTDDQEREYGTEYQYYACLNPPYAPKNGPMDSIEELLLVRGVTPQLLFGLDSNHNGILDLDEQYSSEVGAYDPDMQLGWANYLTLFSKESNLNPAGLERININSDNLEQLYDDLRSVFNEQWSTFIIAYRQNGPASPPESDDESVPPAYVPVDPTKPAGHTFTQVLDLIDAYTTATYEDEDGEMQTVKLASPITFLNLPQTMPIVMSNLTTISGDNIPGRINLMQAPRRVLEGVPGMTPEIADEIIQRREFELDDPDITDRNRAYETWILVEGIVDLPTMKLMLPFVCTSGKVYRAEIVGYFQDSVATSRAEVILDTTVAIPRILFWRDKSHLQSGYSVDTLGIDLQY